MQKVKEKRILENLCNIYKHDQNERRHILNEAKIENYSDTWDPDFNSFYYNGLQPQVTGVFQTTKKTI